MNYKFILLFLIILICLVLSAAVNIIHEIDIVYTHFFYIPIILTGIWYPRYAVFIAVAFGLIHITNEYAAVKVLKIESFLRSAMFIVVAYVTSYLAARKDRLLNSLRESEEKFRMLAESSPFAIMMHRGDRWIYANRAAMEISGYTEEELYSMHFWDFVHPDHRDMIKKRGLDRQQGMMLPRFYEFKIIAKNGVEKWVSLSGNPILYENNHAALISVIDITERKRMEAEILALSLTDQLTGLHNRRGFLSLAKQQLKLAERNKSGMLLFFVDLDGLKWINDTFGHEEGDKALIEIATVFKETFRTADVIARLGGDEYAALTVDIPEANSSLFTARLQSLIDTRNNQENRRYKLSISVGCSYYDPEKPSSIDELMASADKLMYEQKQNKKGVLLQRASMSISNFYTSLPLSAQGSLGAIQKNIET